jgi:hypothetical protein
MLVLCHKDSKAQRFTKINILNNTPLCNLVSLSLSGAIPGI